MFDDELDSLDSLDWQPSELAMFFIAWAVFTLILAAVIVACYWFYGD